MSTGEALQFQQRSLSDCSWICRLTLEGKEVADAVVWRLRRLAGGSISPCWASRGRFLEAELGSSLWWESEGAEGDDDGDWESEETSWPGWAIFLFW